MLMSSINPPGIELCSYTNFFFCFGWKTCSLNTSVKTLRRLVPSIAANLLFFCVHFGLDTLLNFVDVMAVRKAS